AAKNFSAVAVVCNPQAYPEILKELRENNMAISGRTRARLAGEVFAHTARYDSLIRDYFKGIINAGISEEAAAFPDKLALAYEKAQDLRYGENPHQKAAFYRDKNVTEPCVSTAVQMQGKELSFNNILDLDAAIESVKAFLEPAACIIKHTNPCGFATAVNLKKAFQLALECDPVSAFGCIVGLNTDVDEKTAKAIISSGFVECVIAPAYTEEALLCFKDKKNIRVLKVEKWDNMKSESGAEMFDIKKVAGGLLIQDIDREEIDATDLKVVTKKKPSKSQLKSLLFGWKVARNVKSNAIVLARGTQAVGIGAGQMSRVDSVAIAIKKAGSKAKGATLASDGFFPKPDGIQKAARAGICAIIQPGGSIADEEIIKAADKAGISMLFTGMRHFRH
ncbi:MAG: bifunctional phosphoribosylaminoimidazolecarboxamide formyltransferase/IMP cyclohydrolase, partial [Candidatus Omnitrophica bacterium]|nr:bifunctional phosphoribosylaminoimidazolecarboxamide formyltransferase/IMP cyclohydrolase [Candidatus Omnitrophota bacterium]